MVKNMGLRMIKALNSILTGLIFLVMACMGVYACYALWDNHQIYQAAEDVQSDMLRLKPDESDENGPSFEELLKLNPDVCAWITMDGTRIDYPVLRGETNLTYINKDVYGNFSLAGSIFLDSRCDREFAGMYSLLYGHHMENGSMFGDLDLYKEERFFTENRTGTLLIPSRAIELETLACMEVAAADEEIFETEKWQEDLTGMLQYIRENALVYDEAAVAGMEESMPDYTGGKTDRCPRMLVLSTCSGEFTNARTVLIAAMREEEKNGYGEEEESR